MPKSKTTIVKVGIYPKKARKYPFQATEITFKMKGKNAVQAVETLMCYMGYGCTQYYFIFADKE